MKIQAKKWKRMSVHQKHLFIINYIMYDKYTEFSVLEG